jgi:ArsR family transcriptional regulator, arsenate/arsenite/antimonite-responsive transcriptional repressor / arsenate reductase (thioredoxin)
MIESMSTEVTTSASYRTAIHAALADPGRLAIVDRLLLGEASPSELQLLLSMTSNLLSHHLKTLESAGLVRRTRSEADGRRTYIRLNAEALEAMVPKASSRADRVLFVCTQNSARSQLAVAIWNRHSSVPSASAGTHPAAAIHPGAVAAANRRAMRLRPSAPAHIDNVLERGDLIVAVCDNAHEELPSDSARIHWSIPDPARTGTRTAFDHTIDVLTARIVRLAPTVQAI